MRLSVVLLAAAAAALHSQTVAPVILEKSPPQYSDSAKQARVNGSVLLNVLISAEGQATNFQILRPLGFGLDEKAIEAVTLWRFKPGTRDGQPIPVSAKIEVSFRFSNKGWFLQKVSFGAADDIQIPSFVSAIFPEPAGAAEAHVTLDCIIDQTGRPTDVKIKIPSGENYEEQVVTALKQWSFKPATRNGQPVPVAASFEFVQRSN